MEIDEQAQAEIGRIAQTLKIIVFALASGVFTFAMVVLFQFAITRRIAKYPPMLVMAFGSMLYAIGLAMYGWVSEYSLFLLAMVSNTVVLGLFFYLVVTPVGLALRLFGEDPMRRKVRAGQQREHGHALVRHLSARKIFLL